MADFAELARQYQVQDYGNPYMGSDMTEDGNVKLQSDSVTNQPEPTVAPAPVNPYEQQAEQLAMGVPTAGTPFTNPVPEQPAAPVAPDQMMAEQPQDEIAALKPGQVAPAQDYNAYIASQESGANPNVGYHYPADAQGQRKSTAYGTYGITAPAYRDVQMADPYFRGKDITTLSPEDQARANTAYRNVQTGQLKALGLEPTEENIRGAQLLGAGGLKRYLDTGTFSNQAARANGGAQNLENILKGRMAGGAAPASQPNLPPQPAPEAAAPAQPPATQPAPEAAPQPEQAPQQPGEPYKDASGMYYDAMGNPVGTDPKHAQNVSVMQTQQDDPRAMATLAYDKTVDPALRRVAAVQLRTQLENESLLEKAKTTLQSAAIDPTAARKLSKAFNSDEGSWLKFLFYQAIGAYDKAKSEQIKLGAGDHWAQSYLMGKDGSQQAVWIKYNGQGAPVDGYGAEGQLAQDQVLAATSMKGVTAHTGKMKDRVTGEVYYEQTGPQGTILKGPTGKVFTGDTKNLMPYGIGSDVQTKNEIQVNALRNKLAFAPLETTLKEIAKYEAEFGPLDETTKNGMIESSRRLSGTAAPGQATTTRAETTTTPVAPGGTATGGTATGGTTTGGTVPGETAPVATGTPAALRSASERKKREEEAGLKLKTGRSENVNKHIDEVYVEQGAQGENVVNERKKQFGIFNRPGVDANKIFGLYNAAQESPGDQKLSIVRDILGGVFKPEAEVSQRLAQLNLDPQTRSALEEYNISNQKINAASLKQNAGPGSVSDAEQKANRAANVDPTKVPALAAYNAMAGSQFNGDLARYRSDWASDKEFGNVAQMEKTWRQEQAKYVKIYEDIAKKRAEYISKNGASTEAVKRGYVMFPIPEYDPNAGQWRKMKPIGEMGK